MPTEVKSVRSTKQTHTRAVQRRAYCSLTLLRLISILRSVQSTKQTKVGSTKQTKRFDFVTIDKVIGVLRAIIHAKRARRSKPRNSDKRARCSKPRNSDRGVKEHAPKCSPQKPALKIVQKELPALKIVPKESPALKIVPKELTAQKIVPKEIAAPSTTVTAAYMARVIKPETTLSTLNTVSTNAPVVESIKVKTLIDSIFRDPTPVFDTTFGVTARVRDAMFAASLSTAEYYQFVAVIQVKEDEYRADQKRRKQELEELRALKEREAAEDAARRDACLQAHLALSRPQTAVIYAEPEPIAEVYDRYKIPRALPKRSLLRRAFGTLFTLSLLVYITAIEPVVHEPITYDHSESLIEVEVPWEEYSTYTVNSVEQDLSVQDIGMINAPGYIHARDEYLWRMYLDPYPLLGVDSQYAALASLGSVYRYFRNKGAPALQMSRIIDLYDIFDVAGVPIHQAHIYLINPNTRFTEAEWLFMRYVREGTLSPEDFDLLRWVISRFDMHDRCHAVIQSHIHRLNRLDYELPSWLFSE